MSEAARWKATVHVGGLAPVVTKQHVYDAFLPFGEIVEVNLPTNDKKNANPDEPHRGFAYVEFEDPGDAKEATDNMDLSELFGRIIKVSPAKAPKSAGEGLGSKTAIWEQETWLAQNAVGEEDRLAAEQAKTGVIIAPDPMQGLEGLDVAGPKPA